MSKEIVRLIECIDSKDVDKFKEVAKNVSFDEKLFAFLLDYTFIDSPQFFDLIFELWSHMLSLKIPFISYLYTVEELDPVILKELTKEKKLSFLSIAFDLLDVEDNHTLISSFKRLFASFSIPSFSEFQSLFYEINERIDGNYDDLVELLDYYCQDAKDNTLKPPSYLKDKASDDFSCHYGPSNIGEDEIMSENKYCMTGQGCHMLLCNHLYEEEEEKEEKKVIVGDGWFTHKCQLCHINIPSPYYAVRRPMATGGWYGCYCSFQCVILHTPVDSMEYHYIEDVSENMIKYLKEKGINKPSKKSL